MLGSYWRYFATAFGCLAFGVAGYLLHTPDSPRVPEQRPAVEAKAERPVSGGAQQPAKPPVAITVVESSEQAVASASREAETRKHDAEDLDAQVWAANAVEQQVAPVWWAAVLSFIGTALIVLTFLANRDTSRRELRAYVMIKSVVCGDIKAGETIFAVVSFINSGPTPALDVVTRSVIFAHSRPYPKSYEKLPELSTSSGPLGPNIEGQSRVSMTKLVDQDIIARIARGEWDVIIHGEIAYRDVFRQRHTSTYRHKLKIGKDGSLAFGVCPTGNDAN